MDPIKLLLAGSKGVGKSSAIAAVSNRVASQRVVQASFGVEPTATLAVGEVALDDGRTVRLVGVPEDCADYRLEMLARDAQGIAFLIDHRDRHALAQFRNYLTQFSAYLPRMSVAVAVTHIENVPGKPLERYHQLLAERGVNYPVFPVDAREAEDVLLLVQALLVAR